MRAETDSLGTVLVPDDVYYGVQTVRAVENFPISGVSIGSYPGFMRSLAWIKLAAARANHRLGDLSHEKKAAIELACADVLAGRVTAQFPVDVFQGGAGTSTNMNMNEVLANLALEHMGRSRGDYDALHPNNDVNQSQSTNDVYPTAIRMTLLTYTDGLTSALEELAAAFALKGNSFANVLKLGRTQLQDAVPMTLGQEFSAFAATIREDIERLGEAAALLREINLGGTAIGTGVTADPRYQGLVLEELNKLTGLSLAPAANLVEAGWDAGAFVSYSSQLKRVAVKLSKIANDLRLLSSGPRGGLCEIRLPAVQPGSSIMPGKVNPVVPEVVNQVAFHVIGADLTVTLAAEAGQLQLNAFEPVIVASLLNSMTLLINVVRVFTVRCVNGIEADRFNCSRHLEASTALITALIPLIGYQKATAIAKAKLATGESIMELLKREGIMSRELLNMVGDPEALTKPFRARLNEADAGSRHQTIGEPCSRQARRSSDRDPTST
ncbi:aspartate ammonia-lyase [Bradyrhizobium japonicum]